MPLLGLITGGGIGETIGGVFDDISGLFGGGRSGEEIAQDEFKSMSAMQDSFFRKYGISLPDATVIGILRPHWNAGVDGAGLWNAMKKFYRQNETQLLAFKQQSAGTGTLQPPPSLAGFDMSLSNPIVLIIIGVGIFMLVKK